MRIASELRASANHSCGKSPARNNFHLISIRCSGEEVSQSDQLRATAKTLVRLQVDVILTSGAGLTKAVQLETKTIPIVVQNGTHLVAAGQFLDLRRMLDAST